MTDTLQAIGNAMRAEVETLRVISQNVANADTVAYRRQIAIMRPEFESLMNDALSSGHVAASIGVPQLEIAFDQTTATLKNTGLPFNVALDGPGFFVIQTQYGPQLTRRGDLQVSPDGVLVSAHGDPVLGEQGVIQIGAATPAISVDGAVSTDGVVLDRLRIAMPASDTEVASLGDGRYLVAPDRIVDSDARATVRQGFLEGSNVMPVNELIQMMETVRRFESEQRFARAYDEMLGKAITELGKTG